MAGSRNRHGRPQGPKISKPHKKRGIISPKAKERLVGIDESMLKPRAMRGGKKDTDRVRLIRDFFSRLPGDLLKYQEFARDISYSFALNKRTRIFEKQIPDDRTFVIDDVYFYATPLVGTGLIPEGTIEGAVETYFEVGNVVPVEIGSERTQTAVVPERRAYFPFLNDRVGPREVTFSVYAKRGSVITAYYINRFAPPVPIRTIGIRLEGWLIDSNAIEEILEQQR
ncbi:MAG: hypothetical protein ACYSWO_19840 [Planctomycetota bacterium]